MFFDTSYGFWGQISSFRKFGMHMLKNRTFSDILQKVKTYCLPTAITLILNPTEHPEEYKIESSQRTYVTSNLCT